MLNYYQKIRVHLTNEIKYLQQQSELLVNANNNITVQFYSGLITEDIFSFELSSRNFLLDCTLLSLSELKLKLKEVENIYSQLSTNVHNV